MVKKENTDRLMTVHTAQINEQHDIPQPKKKWFKVILEGKQICEKKNKTDMTQQ